MFTRFVLGLGLGFAGSLTILQCTTDRRILTMKRPDDRDESLYQYRLFQLMVRESKKHVEGSQEKAIREKYTNALTGVRDGLETVVGGSNKE